MPTLTLAQLNAATPTEAAALLHGIYEHSPWVAERAVAERPFASLLALEQAMCTAVRYASADEQLVLLRAHPELAGKAMLSQNLTAESSHEQATAGLTHCSTQEFATIQSLNAQYNLRFGWPFILAVRGPRGTGLSRQQIIQTFDRRLRGHADFERAECLRNVHRIAQMRLAERFAHPPVLGNELWDWHEALAVHSDPGFLERGELTVTYLTPAHQACAQGIAQLMRNCGFDSVAQDAVGNVVGNYYFDSKQIPPMLDKVPNSAKKLLTGSHFDTVRNGGKYDGRLGILAPLLCVKKLHENGRRLPFGIEVVAFAEEEGQRYKATFLGSGALLGQFNPAWLAQQDADGTDMASAMRQCGLNPDDIPGIRRDPADYLGFVELHIEQGPVLNEIDLPLGVVTSINGSVRMMVEMVGVASHAGTTPMNRRRDAASGMAELAVFMEARAARDGDSVATMGMIHVPNGSINVVPGRCHFSLDMRAPTDAQRDLLVGDVLSELRAICDRRGLVLKLEETLRASAAPSAPAWQRRWERAVQSLGLPLHRMTSGAGHDAMKLHEIMPQAMLFVRGENAGISHNPLECSNSHDLDAAVRAFQVLLEQLALEMKP